MIEEECPQPQPGYGHNSGASLEAMRAEQAAAMRDTLREGKTWEDRKREFLLSASRQIVTDRHSAAGAADTIRLAAIVKAAIMEDRQARTEPYYQIHRQLSAMANEFWDPVDEAMQKLKGQIDAWTAEEDARIAKGEAEQAAMIAALRSGSIPTSAAPAEPAAGRQHIDYSAPSTERQAFSAPAMRQPARKKIRGDLGSTISSVEQVEYEIEDFSLIPEHILKSPAVTEAILSVVKRTAKQLGVPAGIRAVKHDVNRIT